jgi:MYXO-CTERM domain-containing protein
MLASMRCVASLAAFALASAVGLAVAPAAAAPIFPGPGAAGYDASLADLAAGFQRQQDVFASLENGLSLDVIFQPTEVQGVRDFFAQTATNDFQAFSGKHPFTVVATFEEWGDEGNFAGISSVGVAARLMVLRASGASSAELDAARAAAVRAARAWHVFGAIGGSGVAARGVRRRVPENPTDPPLPGALPTLTPLADGSGNPLPANKDPVWRAAVAPGFDEWIWIDDTSKDQVSGYALAAAWLWDALHDDPDAPPGVADDLAHDLGAFAHSLMKVAPELGIDLCIRDADGRLTSFHDLNPRQLSPDGVLPPTSALQNGFNAAMALGLIRAAYHVTGDDTIGRYYYEDLVGKRDFPALAAKFSGIVFVGAMTNYSNVNMLAIALATIGRFETDDYVLAKYGDTLATQFWSTGSDRDVSHVKQAWFDVLWGGFSKASGSDDVPGRMTADLGGFQPAPAFERDLVNCDDTEIAAGVCTAVDGSTQIALEPTPGHGGGVVAKDIVPLSVRPDTDFAWRSDPHQVNGNASSLMDPRGDWLTAYWLGRLFEVGAPDANRSPNARPALPYSRGEGGGGGGAGGAAAGAGGGGAGGSGSDDGGGCGCAAAGVDPAGGLACALGLAALAARRRRIRRR